MILEELDRELDVRDQWLGIKRLKSTYVPQSFCRRDEEGNHIPMNMRAEEAAKYLETKQWAEVEDNTDKIYRRKITGKNGT